MWNPGVEKLRMAVEQSGYGASARRQESKTQDWLVGGGEMGKLIRSMDWSATSLGPIESWSQSLRTTVSLCLASNCEPADRPRGFQGDGRIGEVAS